VVTVPLPVEPKGHEVDPIRPGIKALTRTGSELVLREYGGREGGEKGRGGGGEKDGRQVK
jgi:hypothetical protein